MPPDEVARVVATSGQVGWLGAISFEDRSTAALGRFAAAGLACSTATLLQYPTTVTQVDEDRLRRQTNLEILTKALGSADTSLVPLDAYSFYACQEVVRQAASRASCLVVDLSCLTKIHALATAAVLADESFETRVLIAYTTPDNYAVPERAGGPGWTDIIIGPLTELADDMSSIDPARGILVAGHETDRLVVGLSEIEPIGGAIVIGGYAERPDLRALAESRNRALITQLTGLHPRDWVKVYADVTDLAPVAAAVDEQVRLAGGVAPIIVYPMGPKPVDFAAAFTLAQIHPKGAWFVYPIPAAYDVYSTEGSGKTHWFRISTAKDLASAAR